MRDFSEQELVRRGKLDKLKEMGLDPFGSRFDVDCFSKEIIDKYGDIDSDKLLEMKVTVNVAGRIMFIRRMGKASFFNIADKLGKIQVYISINDIGEESYSLFKSADLGDFVGIKGRVMKTKTGEVTIKCTEYKHLVKALRPLPEKFHGLTDPEERNRRRYVDLIMNEESRRIAFLRPRIIRAIQSFMDGQGYTEVETPILTPLLTGASARPFLTHHNALDMDMYLRIALELPLKRLLVAGMDGVYEIGRVFRNEGIDSRHNPEFTEMEAYKAFSDLEGMMEQAEGLFRYVAKEAVGKTTFNWLGHEIDLEKKFERVSMVEAIKNVTGIDFDKLSFDECLKIAEEKKIHLEEHEKQYGHIVSKFFEEFVEDSLIQPTFVYRHPIEISPLTKKEPDDERFTQRFELFIGGKEFANAYTELNDPIDQLERFEAQIKEREMGNDEANDIDMDYVEALEYGLPPAGGIGYGIDRMVMLFSEHDSIRDIILFPTMKPEK